mgnify:CR=1 FL=1
MLTGGEWAAANYTMRDLLIMRAPTPGLLGRFALAPSELTVDFCRGYKPRVKSRRRSGPPRPNSSELPPPKLSEWALRSQFCDEDTAECIELLETLGAQRVANAGCKCPADVLRVLYSSGVSERNPSAYEKLVVDCVSVIMSLGAHSRS